jgi:hypothetical protein
MELAAGGDAQRFLRGCRWRRVSVKKAVARIIVGVTNREFTGINIVPPERESSIAAGEGMMQRKCFTFIRLRSKPLNSVQLGDGF